MTKRATWLELIGFFIPGGAQMLAGNRRFGRFVLGATLTLLAVVIVLVVLFFVARAWMLSLLVSPLTIEVARWVLIGYAVLWGITAIDTFRLVRIGRTSPRGRWGVTVLAVVLAVAAVLPAGYASNLAGSTNRLLTSVFTNTEGPSQPSDGRYNILVMGGDEGPDRSGVRPDSIMVVSIDASNGAISQISLPRDLENVPFAEGSVMASHYPDGYTVCDVDVCRLNSIYTEISVWNSAWYDGADIGTRPAPVQGMVDAAEGITGLDIQYYALIQMQGFEQLVDAIGGVEINVRERIPMGAGHDEAGNEVPIYAWIEPGLQRLDGFTALWYARSRFGSNDFERQQRQAELQQAILDQVSPITLLTRLGAISDAGSQVLDTDLPQSMVATMLSLAADSRSYTVNRVGFDGVDLEDPDWAAVRQMISDALAAPAVPAAPPPVAAPPVARGLD